jgi:hypothetical protein
MICTLDHWAAQFAARVVRLLAVCTFLGSQDDGSNNGLGAMCLHVTATGTHPHGPLSAEITSYV